MYPTVGSLKPPPTDPSTFRPIPNKHTPIYTQPPPPPPKKTQEEDYKTFLEKLAKGPEKLPPADQQLDAREAAEGALRCCCLTCLVVCLCMYV